MTLWNPAKLTRPTRTSSYSDTLTYYTTVYAEYATLGRILGAIMGTLGTDYLKSLINAIGLPATSVIAATSTKEFLNPSQGLPLSIMLGAEVSFANSLTNQMEFYDEERVLHPSPNTGTGPISPSFLQYQAFLNGSSMLPFLPLTQAAVDSLFPGAGFKVGQANALDPSATIVQDTHDEWAAKLNGLPF